MTSSSQAPDENWGWLRVLWQRGWLKGCLLVVAVFLAYQPAWHAGFIWDDDVYVTQNPLLTAPDGLKRIWFSLNAPSQYFPLTYTTFRVERTFWGLNPAGYHGVNILLHAVNALLVWRLLKRLSVPGGWLAAAIFALHPVQVESVAWITERKNVLSLFFYLLALLAWIEFVEKRPKPWWRFYFLSLIFYLLALFSKTTACTLPAALLLVLWLKEKPVGWFRLAQVIPFLVLGAGMGLVTVWWERYHQGTQGALFSYGLPERILIASHAIWFYAGKLVWPVDLTFSYPRWTINAADPLAYGWLGAGAGLGAAIYFARRFTGRGVGVAALFYVATLSPMLGFIMLYTFRYAFVADHYQYVASIGPIALAAAGMTRAFGSFEKKKPFLRPVLGGTLLLALSVLTWRQCGMYANPETLWRATIAKNPISWLAHNNLGYVLRQNGQVDEAIIQYQKALEIDPEYAKAHYNLGNALFQKGRVDEAMEHYQKALKIQPQYAEAHNNLGNVLRQKGRVDEAIIQYQKALKIEPDFAMAHHNLGMVLDQKGLVDEAITQYQKALAIQPADADAHINLGIALFKKGRVDEAIARFQKALEISPGNPKACYNLARAAWLLATSPEPSVRNGDRAIALAGQVEQLSGGRNPVINMTLAAAYADAGRFPEAIAEAGRAQQLAAQQGNASLADFLGQQIKLYQAGTPFCDTNMHAVPTSLVPP
jgi:tetratricopeptide (TPR) repeat protein